MTLHRGQDIALSQLVTHRWLGWCSCPSAGDSPVQGMALREPVSPTAPPSPGKQPGHSQVGHIWKSELSLLLFPLRWTVLAWAVCQHNPGTGFQITFFYFFFPCGCFSKVDSGDGKRC